MHPAFQQAWFPAQTAGKVWHLGVYSREGEKKLRPPLRQPPSNLPNAVVILAVPSCRNAVS